MSRSYDVKYITTESSKLNEVPVIDGQIITLLDKDAWFYDMGNTRRPVTGQYAFDDIPADLSHIVRNSLVAVVTGENKGIYWWDGADLKSLVDIEISNDTHTAPTEGKIYLAGSLTDDESTETLRKSPSVYVQGGKIYANGFIGGAVDEATHAASADSATSASKDDRGQSIAATYIKTLTLSADTLTVTYGNGSVSYISFVNSNSVTGLVVANTNTGNQNTTASNGNVHLNLFDDDILRASHKIYGSGGVSVTSNVNGDILIQSSATWQPNTSTQPGYVATGEPNKIWATDEYGEPAWRTGSSSYIHPESGVVPGEYTKVKVNAEGHVTEGTNPTTLSGYGIIDGFPYRILEDDADLDLITEPGVYVGLAGNSISNKVIDADAFGLLVLPEGASGCVQKFFSELQYTRHKLTSVFTSWEQDKLTDTIYTHPTTPGFLHIPIGGALGQVLVWSGDGQAIWGDVPSSTASNPEWRKFPVT